MASKTTACPKCRTQLDISGFKPGQRIRCGACNTVLRIPGEAPAPGPRTAVPPPPSTPPPPPGGGATQKVALSPPPRPTPAPAPQQVTARMEKKDDVIGHVVGGEFEIVGKLGEGGYGAVYEAIDRTLHRKVAVKLMLASRAVNKEYVSKFYREARTAGQLSHPNIVAIHDVRQDEELKTHYLAMEYVEGVTLHDILQERGPLDVAEAVDIISQCCRGLAAAHVKNIIHRDIKPGNIMITPSKVVKIADFGLAKVFDAEEQAKSMVIGTPFFMPPEQFEGKAKDGRTDIYALGVTFYYMLSMKRPFTGSTPAQILVAIMTKEPTPITELRPEIPGPVWKVIRRMIHRDLDQRYQDCYQILDDLAALSSGPAADRAPCPECAAPNDLDAVHCTACGSPMKERCPVCGAEEEAGLKFCGDCGSNVPLEKEVKALAREGKALLGAGEFARAIAKLREAKEKSPINTEVAGLLREAESRLDALGKERSAISALIAGGDFDAAGERVEKAMATYQGHPELESLAREIDRARKASGRGQGKSTVQALLKARRYAEAREAAERLLMAQGTNPELGELLAEAREALDRVEEAAAAAREREKAGGGPAALEAWRAVLDLDPEHGEARRRILEIEERTGALDGVLEAARRAVEEGNPSAAVRAVGDAGGGASRDPRVEEVLGRALAAQKELAGAAEAIRRRALGGDVDGAAEALAALRGKFPSAPEVPALEEEVRAARRAAEVRDRVGRLESLAAEGKWAEVREVAAAVLAEDPENAAAREAAEKAKASLARAAERTVAAEAAEKAGRLEEAEAAFREAAEASPADAAAAEGLERVGRLRKEVADLRRKAEQSAGRGDPKAALGHLRALLALLPSDTEAAAAVRRIEEEGAERLRGIGEVEELLASGEIEEAVARAEAFAMKHPGDAEGEEVRGIAVDLLATRDRILDRVERLLSEGSRRREAARLAQVALRILPGDPRAATLLAKAKSGGTEATP